MLCHAMPCCQTFLVAAEAAGPTADEEADIMALVALNLSRDQALQQEVGQTEPAGHEVRGQGP